MRRHLAGVVGFLGICVSSPAGAAPGWNCVFEDHTDPSNGPRKITLDVAGETLNWNVKAAIPDRFGKLQVQTMTFGHRILVDNGLAIVAASGQAETNKNVGDLIGADVITINKRNGDLHDFSVGEEGSHDLGSGHCDLAK